MARAELKLWKKDDEMGRWICDFRPLNKSTVKRATATGDVTDKVRRLSRRRWKTGLDCWSGFNQMGAIERAKRCLQIITSHRVVAVGGNAVRCR